MESLITEGWMQDKPHDQHRGAPVTNTIAEQPKRKLSQSHVLQMVSRENHSSLEKGNDRDESGVKCFNDSGAHH
jgi:hypothetical protein